MVAAEATEERAAVVVTAEVASAVETVVVTADLPDRRARAVSVPSAPSADPDLPERKVLRAADPEPPAATRAKEEEEEAAEANSVVDSEAAARAVNSSLARVAEQRSEPVVLEMVDSEVASVEVAVDSEVIEDPMAATPDREVTIAQETMTASTLEAEAVREEPAPLVVPLVAALLPSECDANFC
jgi:hypothetical protein